MTTDSKTQTIALTSILAVLLLIIAGMLMNATRPQAEIMPQPRAVQMQPSRITLSQFMKIEDGMSYQAIARLLGRDGTELSRSNLGGASTVIYQWQNDDLSNMNAMFQNGQLISKAQFGLR